MNLDDIFRDTARRQPGKPAVLGPDPGDGLSYRRLDEAVGAAADGLRQAGLRPGGCVGLHLPSGASYIVFTYAVWRCGGCVIPVPVELAAPEKQEICREIAVDLVISEGRAASFLEPFRTGDAVVVARSPDRAATGTVLGVPVVGSREHPAGFGGINSAFIRFTSGTTGACKGVVLSHETIHERIHVANEVLRIGPDDRVLWVLSMAYHFAVSIVSYLSFGAAVVLPCNHFAAAVLDAARRHRATLLYGSPAHYAWLAGCDRGAALPSLRLALSTTAGLDPATAGRFRERFGLPVAQALGIIEVGLPFINLDFAADRSESVGRVLPAYRLLLQDVGLGEGLREILLSGPGCLDAYYDPWRPRASIMPDGWFRTGDVGEVDADGCLFLRGRLKDVINVLGMKFFPQEVEAVLTSHPAVAGASVFARPDPRLGEVPEARVVLRPGLRARPSERELMAHCRQRLADFKVPQRIEFVEALARTASGKVLRRDPRPSVEASRDRH
jgi:long-chain acyl-CoA synthetase